MRIKLWGVRGSIPSPLTPEEIEEKIYRAILGLPDIDTNDSSAVRAYLDNLSPLARGSAGGNTSCVEVQSGGETIIIDAGSGIRNLSRELMKGPCARGEGVLHLLFTHCHWDHIQGFPFFTPAFVPGNRIKIYGVHDIEAVLRDQQKFINWPISIDYMQATFEFIHLEPGAPFSIGDLQISTLENRHPGKAYAFRFEDGHSIFVHASDAEYDQLNEASLRPHLDFFKDADVLIFDAQFTQREAWEKVGWGHSSSLIGVDLARRAGVKKLILFHHDPTYSDEQLQQILATTIAYQAQDPARPMCEVVIAQEGLTLDLIPPSTADLQYGPGDDAAILAPPRTFDERGVDVLSRQVNRLEEMGWPASLVIDLSRVETFGMAGLKALISLRQQHEETSMVLAGPPESVRQVIELAGFLDFFAIYPSIPEALAALQISQTINLPGQLLKNRYRIENKIGAGRRGTAFEATDTYLKQSVALKVLSSSFSQQAIDRFLAQAQLIKALDHPHIVKVLDYDKKNGLAYIVEEFVAGETLRDRLAGVATRPLSVDEALDISVDIALALEYAHSRGVIHGNLTPKNIRLGSQVKLSNFGMGCLEEEKNLLEKPLLILTAPYIAPEQILGQPLDARTDLYTLGVILYELFTGQLPFSGEDREIMEAHLHQPPHPPRELNPDLSPLLADLILKLLAKNPNYRYADAQEVRLISSSLVVSRNGARRSQRALVGHQEPLQLLQAAWQEARAGRGQMVFIAGEAGIGKTHLAQTVAIQSGAAVCLSVAGQRGQTTPYHLFVEALKQYFLMVPPELFDEEARDYIRTFAHLVPEIGPMMANRAQTTSPPEPEPSQLMTSLTRFIEKAAQDRPWILILDDLQWAERCSLKLLRFLADHIPSLPLLLIGAYRDAALGPTHPLREILQDLREHPAFHSLTLGALTRDEVRQILVNLWRRPLSNAIIEKVYKRSRGNPALVEEAARRLLEDEPADLETSAP